MPARATIARMDGTTKVGRGFPWRLLLALLLALGGFGATGYYAWTLREAQAADVARLAELESEAALLAGERARVGAVQEELTSCRGELDGEKARCNQVEDSIESMRADLSATRVELDDLRKQREESARRLAAFRDMTAKFQKMIDSGQLDVAVRDGQMLVNLPAGVLFESGSAELSRAGELALMEVAVVLRSFDDRKFMVVGHTDDRPLESSESARYRNNWELSTARAVTVVDFLIEARLDPKNLIAAGLGQHAPVAKNKTAAGRQQNRRIEIVLLPKLEEMPPMPEELVGVARAEDEKED